MVIISQAAVVCGDREAVIDGGRLRGGSATI